jgi:Protein of unknown function (DUF4019)
MRRIATFIGMILFAISIQAATTREEAAIQAAMKWLISIDAGNYGESWDAASTGFKQAMSRDRWVDAMRGVREPLGKRDSRKTKSAEFHTNLHGVPDSEYVVIQFDTAFVNKNGVETVTMSLEKDGAWRVAGYFVR